ncbi:LytTR family transcriptional regulator [Paenibacillus pinistramenti]|uniref:LytTR family transcriptional regulator n=1 Tax=Paenibacillus pinistramenti TaxID=1768003 RepID=UPI001107FE3E|nr:LytTR family transcriptional regulator [Paenibacillus pinistramenti]
MNVAYPEKDVFENFSPAEDAYFFKIGSKGLVSFHGRNYTIKRKLTAEEQLSLMNHPSFVRVAHQCYANKDKISGLENQMLFFGDKESYPRTLTVAPWLQRHVKKQLSH